MKKYNDTSSQLLSSSKTQNSNYKENKDEYLSFCTAMTGINLQSNTPDKKNIDDVMFLPSDSEDGEFTASFL